MKNIWLLSLLPVLLTCKAVNAQKPQALQDSPHTMLLNGPFIARNINSYVTDTAHLKTEYLKKSKNQRTAGWVMLGGGVAMGIIGGITFSENFEIFGDGDTEAADMGGILFLTGAGCALGSIPFFVSSARNAGRAVSLSISNQEIFLPEKNSFATKPQPSLRLRIGF
jgi:hypothetical protein